MALKKGFEKISLYFSDKRMVILIGVLCLVYFLACFLPGDRGIANILPPLPGLYYVLLGCLIGFYQGMTWKSFQFFQGDWYRHLMTWMLLVSEFALMMFAASLLSWPFYFIYLFLQYLFKLS